jgi:hypothetical protein
VITKEQISTIIGKSIATWREPKDWAAEVKVDFDDLKAMSHQLGSINNLRDGAMNDDLWAMGFQVGFEVARSLSNGKEN